MIAHHEDDLICDMAETYNIHDMRALPVRRLAVLACGLSEDSRVKRAMSGTKLTTRDMILCIAVDKLSQLVWMQTKDGAKNRNRPKSLLLELTEEKSDQVRGFRSIEEFEAARRRIIGE